MADTTTTVQRDDISLVLRLVLAGAVVLATVVSWAFIWDLGFRFVQLALILGAPPGIRASGALTIGWFLQWILAALSLLLVASLLARPKYIRAIVQAWFLILSAYGVTGLIAFRDLDVGSLLFLVPAIGVLGWILYLTGVRPNMRLKLTARVN